MFQGESEGRIRAMFQQAVRLEEFLLVQPFCSFSLSE
jgi:hypothetical protein